MPGKEWWVFAGPPASGKQALLVEIMQRFLVQIVPIMSPRPSGRHKTGGYRIYTSSTDLLAASETRVICERGIGLRDAIDLEQVEAILGKPENHIAVSLCHGAMIPKLRAHPRVLWAVKSGIYRLRTFFVSPYTQANLEQFGLREAVRIDLSARLLCRTISEGVTVDENVLGDIVSQAQDGVDQFQYWSDCDHHLVCEDAGAPGANVLHTRALLYLEALVSS